MTSTPWNSVEAPGIAQTLRCGDVLDQPAFDARFAASPRNCTAELVDGIVYLAAPATHHHGTLAAAVLGLIGQYAVRSPGTSALGRPTVIMDSKNEPQPDAILRLAAGGTSEIDKKGYLVGVPELHVEIAYSSESIDLHQKRRAYERAGVKEYIVVLIREPGVRAFRLEQKAYREVPADDDGIWRSAVFPGLWLNVRALLERDGKTLLETLQNGIDTNEHRAFVERPHASGA